MAVVGQCLRRGFPAGAVRGVQDGLQIGLELARAEAVQQHRQREQQPQQFAQRRAPEQPFQQPAQDQRQQQGQRHAAATAGVRQLRHPATEQAVPAPACQLRHDVQQAEGDEGDEQTDGHDGADSRTVAAIVSDVPLPAASASVSRRCAALARPSRHGRRAHEFQRGVTSAATSASRSSPARCCSQCASN